jgi:hypothetical protein
MQYDELATATNQSEGAICMKVKRIGRKHDDWVFVQPSAYFSSFPKEEFPMNFVYCYLYTEEVEGNAFCPY